MCMRRCCFWACLDSCAPPHAASAHACMQILEERGWTRDQLKSDETFLQLQMEVVRGHHKLAACLLSHGRSLHSTQTARFDVLQDAAAQSDQGGCPGDGALTACPPLLSDRSALDALVYTAWRFGAKAKQVSSRATEA